MRTGDHVGRGRRCWRSPRCSPSGRGGHARPATRSPRRSPSARSTPCRSRARSPLALPRRREFCIVLAGFPVARARALRPARGRRGLRGGHRRSSGRSSGRAWTAASRGSTTRTFAEKLEPTKAEAFSWTHSYGPMTWSRDGRELLRIKASVTGLLEGHQPRRVRRRALAQRVRRRATPPSSRASTARWLQTIKVVDRGLRSTQFVGAGDVRDILPGASRLALPQSDGTFVTSKQAAAPRRQLPGARLRPAPDRHPAQALRHAATPATPQDFLEPARAPARGVGRPRGPGDGQAARLHGRHPLRARRHRRRGRHRVAQRLRRRAGRRQGDGRLALRPALHADPADQARARRRPTTSCRPSIDRVQQGTNYDETPPRAPFPLASFLFDPERLLPAVLRGDGAHAAHGRGARRGSRRASAPALQQQAQGLRRARHRRALVGRGLLPALRLGHLRPDAGRVAGQLADRRRRPERQRRAALPPNFSGRLGQSGDRPFAPGDPGSGLAPSSGGGGWKLPVGAAIVALAALFSGVMLWRRRTPVRDAAPELPSWSARCTAPGATRRPT